MKLVRNERGWVAQSHEVLPMLGVPAGGHLPKEGLPPTFIQGVFVWVEPAMDPKYKEQWGQRKLVKSSRHRVMCACPECGTTVSLGRLAQHAKVHQRNQGA
jgi:hypothetical protein